MVLIQTVYVYFGVMRSAFAGVRTTTNRDGPAHTFISFTKVTEIRYDTRYITPPHRWNLNTPTTQSRKPSSTPRTLNSRCDLLPPAGRCSLDCRGMIENSTLI